jgi:hypothetical protein
MYISSTAKMFIFSERWSVVSCQWSCVVNSGTSKSTMITLGLSISLVDMGQSLAVR